MATRAPDAPTALPQAVARAQRARDRLRALRVEQDSLTEERDQAIAELSALGLSYDEISRVAGVSRARVGQIVTRGGPAQPPRRQRR
jgi:DNA-directed RNA polymerase specialized sigma24 family protein